MRIVEYSKQAHDICKRPYTKYAILASDGFWISVCQEFNDHKEFMNCYSQGDTSEEALLMLEDAMLLWVQCLLDDGMSIPEPSGVFEVSDNGNVTSYTYSIDFSEYE